MNWDLPINPKVHNEYVERQIQIQKHMGLCLRVENAVSRYCALFQTHTWKAILQFLQIEHSYAMTLYSVSKGMAFDMLEMMQEQTTFRVRGPQDTVKFAILSLLEIVLFKCVATTEKVEGCCERCCPMLNPYARVNVLNVLYTCIWMETREDRRELLTQSFRVLPLPFGNNWQFGVQEMYFKLLELRQHTQQQQQQKKGRLNPPTVA
jgi:hypothetical protein